VLLANLRPGATERMGIGPEVLQRLNPRLIENPRDRLWLAWSYAHRPGIDPWRRRSWACSALGRTGEPPVFPSQLAPTDFTTGGWERWGPFSPCSSESATRCGAACR